MYDESIYSDNFQRTLIVGMLQDRINYLENELKKYSPKFGDTYNNIKKEINSLKDFLFFHS